MKSPAVCLFFTLFLVAYGPPARASGQNGSQTSPSQRFTAAAAAFPAPSSKDDFTEQGDLYFNGAKGASLTLSAKATTDGKTPIWHVEDHMTLAAGVGVDGSADLTRSLNLIRGTDKDTTSKPPVTTTWDKKGSSIHLSVAGAAKTAKTKDVPCSASAISTWAGNVLLCRLIGASSGDYAFTMFISDPSDKHYMIPMTLTVDTAGKWKGKAALLYSESSNEGTAKLALDPKTLDLLGMEIDLKQSPKVEFVPKGAETEPKKATGTNDAFYTPPAKTPIQAACIMAFAAGTKKVDLFINMFDWPSMYRVYRTAQPNGPLTEQQLKEAVRKHVKSKRGKISAAEMKAAIEKYKADIQVQKDGNDRATVTMPKSLGGNIIEVQNFGGAWRVIKVT